MNLDPSEILSHFPVTTFVCSPNLSTFMNLTLRSFLPSLLFASTFLGAGEKPNLVVFISDDLGRLDTSIHGSIDARTPTMERLAAEGMTFDDAYVASPSCCPSRFSLLTGLMPARHGAHPNHSQVKPGTKFLPPILKKMGYHLSLIHI